jgi:hypothetical protein
MVVTTALYFDLCKPSCNLDMGSSSFAQPFILGIQELHTFRKSEPCAPSLAPVAFVILSLPLVCVRAFQPAFGYYSRKVLVGWWQL